MKNLVKKFLWWFAGIAGIWRIKLEHINNEPVPGLGVISSDCVAIFDSLHSLNLNNYRTQKTLEERISYTILCAVKWIREQQNLSGRIIVPTTDPEILKEYICDLGIEIKSDPIDPTYKNSKVTTVPFGISLWSLNIDQRNKRRLELLNIVMNYPY